MPISWHGKGRGPGPIGPPQCAIEDIAFTCTRAKEADKGKALGYQLTIAGNVRLFYPGETLALLPFSGTKTFRLYIPQEMTVAVGNYTLECGVFPAQGGWRVGIKVALVVQASARTGLILPAKAPNDKGLLPTNIETNRVFAGCLLTWSTCLEWSSQPAPGLVYQYNAFAQEGQQMYTDADEITEYGDQGILAPAAVSWVELFINGVLQPPSVYTVAAGLLTLIADDLPLAGSPIILRFITVLGQDGLALPAANYQFCTRSDGVKTVYEDSDEIPAYGSQGIPDPATVSYFNLYINGVLQPKTNYQVAPGVLTLNITEPPIAGAPITLQAIVLPGDGGPLPAQVSIFSAKASGSHYTDQDGIAAYDSSGILNPAAVSFHCLMVNGIAQPEVTYALAPGELTLFPPLPLENGPITLQFVSIFAEGSG